MSVSTINEVLLVRLEKKIIIIQLRSQEFVFGWTDSKYNINIIYLTPPQAETNLFSIFFNNGLFKIFGWALDSSVHPCKSNTVTQMLLNLEFPLLNNMMDKF